LEATTSKSQFFNSSFGPNLLGQAVQPSQDFSEAATSSLPIILVHLTIPVSSQLKPTEEDKLELRNKIDAIMQTAPPEARVAAIVRSTCVLEPLTDLDDVPKSVKKDPVDVWLPLKDGTPILFRIGGEGRSLIATSAAWELIYPETIPQAKAAQLYIITNAILVLSVAIEINKASFDLSSDLNDATPVLPPQQQLHQSTTTRRDGGRFRDGAQQEAGGIWL